MSDNEIRIKLLSFDYRLLDIWVRKIVELAHINNTVVLGPIPLPTKRTLYTVLKSPHVNKPSMEQFEKKIHKRLIVIKNYNNKLISDFQKFKLPTSLDIDLKIK